MKNWKTTLAGIIAGLPQIILAAMTHDWVHVITGTATLAAGVLAKDADSKE